MKNHRFLSLVVLILAMFALIVTTGCAENAKPQSYTAYGTVRSVWLEPHGYNSRTVISFAPDSDPAQLIAIEFGILEPRLWKDMHAVISYELWPNDFAKSQYCLDDGRPLLKLVSVKEIR